MLAGELRKQKTLFAIADALAILGAFAAALRIHDPSYAIEDRLFESGDVAGGAAIAVTVLLWLLVFRSNDLYRLRAGGYKELTAIVKACSIATLLTLLAGFLAHVEISRITVGAAWLISIPFAVSARAGVRLFVRQMYANPKISIPLLIVGMNPVGQYLCDQVLDEIGPYEPVAFIDEGPAGRHHRGLPVMAEMRELRELASLCPAMEVAIALPEAPREKVESIINLCDDLRVNWWIVPWMIRSLARGLRIEQLGVVPLIGRRGSNIEGLNFVIKRAFDVLVSTFLLILSAPIIALAAAAVILDDGRPIFFRQARVGVHGLRFDMLKLRTMRSGANDSVHRDFVRNWIEEQSRSTAKPAPADGQIFKITNDRRVTRVGRLLRRFSIDELPQLINVARGQMSLIGPRPALPYELELYKNWHRRRLDVLPGITGLWQVSGRNQLSFEEMVRLDVQYLEDWSLVGDLKILARTLPALLRGSGV